MRYLIFCMLLLVACVGNAQPVYDASIKPAAAAPAKYLHLLQGKRIGLVINQASVADGKNLLDILLERKIKVRKIFVPEHGFRGKEDAGAHIDNSTDSATGLPVISLYGKHKQPTTDDLKDIDVLVYDLQDVGVRFYTYISTLEYCMLACAENHRQFIVLDRPNPNGFYVDGPVLARENKSFVGMQCIPVVYGMTAGEYAKMLRGEFLADKLKTLDLQVVKCVNYTHSKKYELPVAPSPNLRTMAAVYAYPSLCLFEGTPVSVGRGTSLPFQQFGCPEFEGKFADTFTPRSTEGARNPPFENKLCYGEVVGHDAKEVLAKAGSRFRLSWLISAHNAYPAKEKFFTPFFVKLCGTTSLQQQITAGLNEDAIRQSWKDDLKAFKKVRKKYLLYEDFE